MIQQPDNTSSKANPVGRFMVAVGGVIEHQTSGKILIIQRSTTQDWQAGPGGAIEYGEKIREGLQREIREELGIEIEVGEMLQLCDHIIDHEQQHWISPTFICKLVAGTPTIMEPGKCDQLGWFSLEAAAQMPLSLVTAEDIRLLQQRT